MNARLLFCSMLVLPAGAAFAAGSPWDGTWKLDEAQSHFTGGTLTYSQGKAGMLHYSDGTTADYDFAADGKERKYWANRTAIWTAPRKGAWDVKVMLDDKVHAQGHLELSEDNKTITESWTSTQPDGSKADEKDVLTRLSGATGLVGTWRVSKVEGGGGPRAFVIDVPASGSVHYQVPDLKMDVAGRADGSDLPLKGPTAAPGMTIAFQALTPTKTRYTMKIDGKVDSMGEQTLATDGRSFTDVNWTPGKENEKVTGVYVKQ
ncbi:MAG: hypothetical protein ACRES2_09590 [Steroidobacteraceae bacterium]